MNENELNEMIDTYITSLKIKKIRHLENVEILISDEKRKHLILTGKNGSGKTSVLDEVKLCFSVEFFGGNDDLDIKYSNLNLNSKEIFSSKEIKWLVSNFYFFETTRKLLVNKPTGVKDTFSNKAEDFEIFLSKKRTEQAFLSFEKSHENKVEQISLWFAHLEKQLQFLFEDDSLNLVSKRIEDRVEFYFTSEHREDFDFNTLSSGYSSILYILFEIIQRMENDVQVDYNKQGIVLIDEVETHLHVSLQKKILPFLTSFFPNVQFIVTTHSPFVLQSEPNAVIYDLEKKERYEDFSNYSSEVILETYFDSDKFSSSLINKMKNYEDLLNDKIHLAENIDKIKSMRNDFYEISDAEANFWIKDLDLKYLNTIKEVIK